MPTLDLSRRADPEDLPELMNQSCTYAELNACLRDIARVNRFTFAHRPTLAWLTDLLAHTPRSQPVHIVDVGCGYGDTLRRIHQWTARRRIPVTLTGIDLNGDAIRAASEATPASQRIRFLHGDAFSFQPAQGIDIVISSLLTHHLADAEIVSFLIWMEASARRGWFINDLHRTAFPFHTFNTLARLLPLHRFVRHDGGVSIRRSFLVEDWRRLCTAANLPLDQVAIREYRPARLCVGRVKAQPGSKRTNDS